MSHPNIELQESTQRRRYLAELLHKFLLENDIKRHVLARRLGIQSRSLWHYYKYPEKCNESHWIRAFVEAKACRDASRLSQVNWEDVPSDKIEKIAAILEMD